MNEKDYKFDWILRQTKGVRGKLFLLMIFCILNSICSMSIAYVIKAFMDYAVGDSELTLMYLIIFSLGVLILISIALLMVRYLESVSTEKIAKKLKIRMFGKIQNMPLKSAEKYHSGELSTKFNEDTMSVAECVPKLISGAIANSLTSIMAITYLFILSWKIALTVMIFIPFLFMMIKIFSKLIKKYSLVYKESEENVRKFFLDHIGILELIKINYMQDKNEKRLNSLVDKKIKAAKKNSFLMGMFASLNHFMGFGSFIIVIGMGAYMVTKGEVTAGTLIGSVQLINYVVWPLSGLSISIANVSKSMASAKRLSDIYETKTEKEVKEITDTEILSVKLDNISFNYEEKEFSIKNLFAAFEKNKIYGIIGESGCGKTTFIKIVSGLYCAESGNIVILDADGNMEEGSIRSLIGYVPSSNLIISGTFLENITLFDDNYDMQKVKGAAIKANIDDYIESLPKKYDTKISESGKDISNGQKQRVAIARAMYSDKQILIFDEPTSALDGESVSVVLNTVKEISKDKICIIVSHSKTAMGICDYLYMIENGAVVREGSFKQLLGA